MAGSARADATCTASLASLSLQDTTNGTNGDHSTTSTDSSAAAPAAPSHIGAAPATAATKARHAKDAFGELLSVMSPLQLVAGENPDAEAENWSLFADVFAKEVRHQEAAHGGELQLERRRQILADILVWAEVTQTRYDEKTASFVTEPHQQDPSFRRIGDMLKAAKAQRGLCQ